MFDEAHEKLEINEISAILSIVNHKVDGSIFDLMETTILAVELPFYPDWRFLHIADHATNPPLERYVFQKAGTEEFIIHNWDISTISAMNKQAAVQINDHTIFEYLRFYYHFVRGRYGKFIVAESVDHFKWKEFPPQEYREKLAQVIKPLQIREKSNTGVYGIDAFMILKDVLYFVDVRVDRAGKVVHQSTDVLIQNMPIIDMSWG